MTQQIDHKAVASRLLRQLRTINNGIPNYNMALRSFENVRGRGKVSLDDLDITAEEFAGLRMAAGRRSAERWLLYLREGTALYLHYIAYLRRDVKAGGLTLLDVETDEVELTALRAKGCRIAARVWLDSFRRHPGRAPFAGCFWADIAPSGLTAANIGATEAEWSLLLGLPAPVLA